MARRFLLIRDDHDATNAPGVAAEGVVFSSGKVCLNWLNYPRSVQGLDSMAELNMVQSQNGISRIQWVDLSDRDTTQPRACSIRLKELMDILEDRLGTLPVKPKDDGEVS